MYSKTKRITNFALYTALAFIFSYIEYLLPIPMPVPGMKIGLANIVLVFVLMREGYLSALGVSIVRTILTAITFGNLFLFFFGFAGSLLSISGMALCKKKLSPIAFSALGGVLHNAGQILVAIILLHSTSILGYFPVLYFTGFISGVLMGIVAEQCEQRMPVSNSMN